MALRFHIFWSCLLLAWVVPADEAAALTWEGKSLTLTLPDTVTVYTSRWERGKRGDSYGCSWKTPERLNDFELDIFGSAGTFAKQDLKPRAEQHLASIKAKIAEFKYKRTCTNVLPLQFRSGGWAGYGFQVIHNDSPKSKSMEAFMLLWGGDRAWQVSFSGTQNQYGSFIRFLESTIWKPKGTAQEQRGLSEMTLPPQEKRSWTNAAGKAFEGTLTAINDAGNLLRIERADGHVFEGIPVNFLSAPDRAYIKTTISEMEKASEASPAPSK